MRLAGVVALLGLSTVVLSGCNKSAEAPTPAGEAAAPSETAARPATEAAPAGSEPQAPEPAPAPPKSQELTEKSIRAALAVAKDPQLKQIGDNLEAASKTSLVHGAAAAQQVPGDVDKVLQQHGFADLEEWSGTLSKLYAVAAKLGIEESVAKAKAQSKGLPPEAAAQMSAALEDSLKQADASVEQLGGASAAEVKAVKKLLPEIQKN
ncbi:MAG: hypothetical protein IT204_09650 [Fimbriimonadaceae bacterium]|nr:hypothetical protein [Fimbriimonadaceae bacterium]